MWTKSMTLVALRTCTSTPGERHTYRLCGSTLDLSSYFSTVCVCVVTVDELLVDISCLCPSTLAPFPSLPSVPPPLLSSTLISSLPPSPPHPHHSPSAPPSLLAVCVMEENRITVDMFCFDITISVNFRPVERPTVRLNASVQEANAQTVHAFICYTYVP